jgi:macrolide transport system ATP-binding/permease protein
MPILSWFRTVFQTLFRRDDVYRDMDKEMENWLATLIEEKVAAGMRLEQARREALLEMGGIERAKERVWEVRSGVGFDGLLWDLRYTLRTLRRNPGFTAVAILSLALGIGANTAIFSIYSSIFMGKLQVRDPDGLVEIYTSNPEEDDFMVHSVSSWLDFTDIRRQGSEVFDDVLVYNVGVSILDTGDDSVYLIGEEVSANYFDMLGVDPVLGRGFIEKEEGIVGAAPTIVIGYEYWQNSYGGDPGVIGGTMTLNGRDFTIIGVAPETFHGLFPLNADYWYPMTLYSTLHPDDTRLTSRRARQIFLKGRLREGTTVEDAQAALDVISARLAQEYPDSNESIRFIAISSSDVSLHPELDTILKGFTFFLMCMVGLVLLIACTNLATMLMARATARRREIGIRLAIGAGRFRLLRQLLTESTLLALLGGIAGLALGWWIIRLLVAFQPPIPMTLDITLGINGNVLLFTFILSIVTGIVFGLLPATQSTRPELISALKDAYSSAGGRLRRFGIKNSLVVFQVAVSALFLVFSGLFLRSLGNVSAIDKGFDIEHGVIATLETSDSGYTLEESRAFYAELLDRFASLPGVVSVGMTDRMPLGYSISTRDFFPVSGSSELDEEGEGIDYSQVDTGYFRTMGIPILSGRDFLASDLAGGEGVLIVNETMAHRFWPGGDAIGSRVAIDEEGEEVYTIIGIAIDGRYRSLGEDPRPYAYFASAQQSNLFAHVIARTDSPAGNLVPIARDHIRQIDSKLPILDIVTVPEHLELMLFIPRALAALLTGLGLLTLILGTTGLYGIIAYDVSRRTREVGIRISLGARKSRVLRKIVLDGLKLVITGTVIGLVLALLTTRFLASMLFGISPTDPVTFLGVTLLFIVVAIAATLRPAWKAADINPVQALQHE